jgi:predicted PurR-regulated permease PerM
MPPPLHARRLLVALLLGAVALATVVLSPFWESFFLAAVLASAFRPWMEWISRQLRGRRLIAAAVLVVVVVLAVVLPLAGAGALLLREVLSGIYWLKDVLASEGVAGLVSRLPGPVEAVVHRIFDAIPQPLEQLQKVAGARGGQAAGALASALTATGGALFRTVMTLIAFFFFLTDGQRLIEWLDGHVPLRPGTFRRFVEEFRRTSVSVLWATLATAGIQTVTATVGYLIARAPNVLFLAVGTFIVALIPAVGGGVMVFAVGLLMLASGHPLAGVFLVLWGVAVVSLVDNVARPYLLKGGMELHGGIIFFALLGGLSVFGAIGLILGPLSIAFLMSVLSMYEREYGLPENEPDPD